MDEQTLEPCPFCGVIPLVGDDVDEVVHPSDGCPAISGLWFRKAAWNHRAAHSVIAGKVAELTDAGAALDRLLRMTVPVPANCVAPEGSPMTPEFRLSVQLVTDEGVHFIIHAHGHSSDTLDIVATKRGVVLLAPFEPGEGQSERIARSAALAPYPERR